LFIVFTHFQNASSVGLQESQWSREIRTVGVDCGTRCDRERLQPEEGRAWFWCPEEDSATTSRWKGLSEAL